MNNQTISTHSNTNSSRFYPWLIWVLASSFVFYKYLLQISPSVMVENLMQTFSLSGTALGNLTAFYFYAYMAMQLPVGLLVDRFSPRHLISIAIALCAIGAWLFSQAQAISTAEIGRLLIGIGGAFSAVGAMKLISLWFPPKRFAMMSGLILTIGMLGAVVGDAPVAKMVLEFGWRQTLLLGALLGAALMAVFWLCVRDRKPITPTHSHTESTHFWRQLFTIIQKPQTWIISIYSGLAFAPISAFAGLWGVPFLTQSHHLARTQTAGLVSLVFIGFAIGAPFSGWLSDFTHRRKPLMWIGTLFGMLILLSIIYFPITSPILLGVCLALFGFFTSFFFISFATVREINNPHYSGTTIGFINMFNAIFGALSQPLIGILLDYGWHHLSQHGVRVFTIQDYRLALLTLPAGMLIALVLLFFVKETHCQQQ